MKLAEVGCVVCEEISLTSALLSQSPAQCTACSRPGNMSCWRAVDEPWGKTRNENESTTVMYENPTMKFIT